MTTSITVTTHQAIDARWSGRVVHLSPQASDVELQLLPEMTVDATGLVHGGFIFSAADYAAMLAVNEPTVLLGSAEVRFLKPSRSGEILLFQARVKSSEAKKRTVAVYAHNSLGEQVFQGSFLCLVPPRHVFDTGTTHSTTTRLEAQKS